VRTSGLRWLSPLVFLAWPALGNAIVLDDTTNFSVKNVWDAANTLGIPQELGGLLFSEDGNTLYAVGASEDPASAVWAIPVTRDPVSRAVTDLGPMAAVTKVFDGDSGTPGSGITAGFSLGPEGTLFYAYWDKNALAERPGGLAGAETQYDMGALGIPAATSGLMFSPHRTDPGTGFGMLQMSANAPEIYDVPLTPAGGGLFVPGTVSLFVTLLGDDVGGIQYVPAGLFAGDVMYVSWSAGEVRRLDVDPTTGLPVDATSMLPTLGTSNPVDERFASDLGNGPWGLAFDPLTGELFVGTWQGNPPNSIVQIGGDGFTGMAAALLPGKKLLVKTKASGVQRLQLKAKSPEIMAADPCATDGELTVEAVGAGTPPVHIPLDAALWKPINAKKPGKGCKYRKGPVVAGVKIKPGKSLKVVANGADLGVPLSTDPRPVRIELRHGSVRHCFEFGGAKGSHKPDKKLLAKNAGPATACPSP
jgi:hypothetical protein